MIVRSAAALVLGMILATYWARVLRMVHKARVRTGRDANFVPREKTGRWLRVLWYPVAAMWVIHPFINAFATRLPAIFQPIYHVPILTWLAVAIALGALATTFVCWKRMGKSWRMGIDPAEKTSLVVTGAYAYVRHPIYALSSLLMLATFIAIPSPLMAVLALIHLTFLQWEARREEQHLSTVHGNSYREYCSRTGRFIPRLFTRFSGI